MRDFTLPTIDNVMYAFARDIVDAFGKDDLRAAYVKANVVAPKLYPLKARLTNVELDKAAELVSDCILLLGVKKA